MLRGSTTLFCLIAVTACAAGSEKEPAEIQPPRESVTQSRLETAAPAGTLSDAEVEVLTRRADSLYASGRFDAAIDVYERVVEHAPETLQAYEPLAYAYAKLGFFQEAEQWFWERRERSDDAALDHCFRADVAVRRGDLHEARLYRDSLVASMATDTSRSFVFCAAEIETHLGEYEEAERRVQRVVTELRQEGEPLHGLSLLAFFALREGDVERGKALLAEHETIALERLERSEAVAVSHFDLAAIEALRGAARAAVRHLKEGLEGGGWGQYWGGYYYLWADPIFKSLRGDPAFERFMAAMRSDIDRMRERVVRNAGEDLRPDVE